MKCTTKYCPKLAAKGRKICHSCVKRAYAEKHPVEYNFQVFKNNAKRRNKEFTLTLEQFKQFAYETQLLLGRGRSSTSWHIDRIDNDKGYTLENIQILTNAENVRKENQRRKREKLLHYDYQSDRGWWIELGNNQSSTSIIEEYCPF